MATIKNRRRGPDAIARMITVFSVISWSVIGFAFLVYQMAKPSASSFDSVRRGLLDARLGLLAVKMLLFINVLVSIGGMVFNLMRNKRKSDQFHVSLVVTALVSLAGFVLMVMFF